MQDSVLRSILSKPWKSQHDYAITRENVGRDLVHKAFSDIRSSDLRLSSTVVVEPVLDIIPFRATEPQIPTRLLRKRIETLGPYQVQRLLETYREQHLERSFDGLYSDREVVTLYRVAQVIKRERKEVRVNSRAKEQSKIEIEPGPDAGRTVREALSAGKAARVKGAPLERSVSAKDCLAALADEVAKGRTSISDSPKEREAVTRAVRAKLKGAKDVTILRVLKEMVPLEEIAVGQIVEFTKKTKGNFPKGSQWEISQISRIDGNQNQIFLTRASETKTLDLFALDSNRFKLWTTQELSFAAGDRLGINKSVWIGDRRLDRNSTHIVKSVSREGITLRNGISLPSSKAFGLEYGYAVPTSKPISPTAKVVVSLNLNKGQKLPEQLKDTGKGLDLLIIREVRQVESTKKALNRDYDRDRRRTRDRDRDRAKDQGKDRD